VVSSEPPYLEESSLVNPYLLGSILSKATSLPGFLCTNAFVLYSTETQTSLLPPVLPPV
jgi:hypothetical protein